MLGEQTPAPGISSVPCSGLGTGLMAKKRCQLSKDPMGWMFGRAEGTWKSLTWILCEGGIKAKISKEEGLGWE